jgi:predicted Rdx family selenoprotein
LRRAAVGLRKAAEQKLGIKPAIKTGGRGELTVWVDGRNVFDHKKDGPWPGADELLRRITAASRRQEVPAPSS